METLPEAIRRVLPPQLPPASRKLGSRTCLQAEKLRLRVVNELDGSTGEQPASQLQKAWSVPQAPVLSPDVEAILTQAPRY